MHFILYPKKSIFSTNGLDFSYYDLRYSWVTFFSCLVPQSSKRVNKGFLNHINSKPLVKPKFSQDFTETLLGLSNAEESPSSFVCPFPWRNLHNQYNNNRTASSTVGYTLSKWMRIYTRQGQIIWAPTTNVYFFKFFCVLYDYPKMFTVNCAFYSKFHSLNSYFWDSQ